MGKPAWAARVHAGIRIHAKSTVEHCFISEFVNAGIWIWDDAHPDGPGGIAIGWLMKRVFASQVATGLFIRGSDAHAGTAISCEFGISEPDWSRITKKSTHFTATTWIKAWTPDSRKEVGWRVRPKKPDGKYYVCSAITGYGRTHATIEPTWDDPGPWIDNEVTWTLGGVDEQSFVAHPTALRETPGNSNARTLFGVETIATDNHIRDLLDAVPP